PYQTDQPFRRTKDTRPAMAAQLPRTERHLGAYLRVESATAASGEESMSRLAQPQLSFADLELRYQGVHLDPLLQGVVAFLDGQAELVEKVRQDLVGSVENQDTA